MSSKTTYGCTLDLGFLVSGWALMLLLGALYNETLTTCAYNTLCNQTSPWPHPGYWVCAGIMFCVHLIYRLVKGVR